MLNTLELWVKGYKKLFGVEVGVMVYVIWVLMSARQNFFMDIATAAVFTHYIFFFIHERIETIDNAIFTLYDRIAGNSQDQEDQNIIRR